MLFDNALRFADVVPTQCLPPRRVLVSYLIYVALTQRLSTMPPVCFVPQRGAVADVSLTQHFSTASSVGFMPQQRALADMSLTQRLSAAPPAGFMPQRGANVRCNCQRGCMSGAGDSQQFVGIWLLVHCDDSPDGGVLKWWDSTSQHERLVRMG